MRDRLEGLADEPRPGGPRHVEEDIGVVPFLEEIRSSLKNGAKTADEILGSLAR